MGRKKPKGPTPEDLKAEADEILRNAEHDAISSILEHVQAISAGMEALKLPSNDPKYLERLQAGDRARVAIANKLTQVDVVRDGNRTYLGVGSFPHGDALDIARRLADHFECKIRSWEQEA